MPRGQGSVGGASAATLGAGGAGGGGSEGELPACLGSRGRQGSWFYFGNYTNLLRFSLIKSYNIDIVSNNFRLVIV